MVVPNDQKTLAAGASGQGWGNNQSGSTQQMTGSGSSGNSQPTIQTSQSGNPTGFGGASQQETVMLRPTKKQPLAWLICKEGSRVGQTFRLGAESTTIGRDAQSDIFLDDDSISRPHAKVKLEPVEGDEKNMAFFIYDLASENGTSVNGKPILKQMLADGDEVLVGRTLLVFKKL